MQPLRPAATQHAFPSLPIELFLTILDLLVSTRDGSSPVAFAPSDSVTKALRALTLVSRDIYPIASRYLYAHCLFLGSCTSFARFRRTLGLHLGSHPQALKWGQASRHEELFAGARIPQHITSLFLSPHVVEEENVPPRVRLPQILDTFFSVGPTLKRLVLDLMPIYATASEIERTKPHITTNNIFTHMTNLEELVCSYDTMDYFPYPPPNLKRLANTQQGMGDMLSRFVFSVPSLETVMVVRDLDMEAMDIENVLHSAPRGRHPPLDVVFVDVSANHRTPEGTKDWAPDDPVRFWEFDVPTSFYGDDDDLLLCDGWIWEHAVRGTLFDQEKRRMKSWSEVQKELEAPDLTLVMH